jgi:glycosyltransferase involved in cell wall biosynthesis
MNDLKFSILIPTYNRASLLYETIESILRQNFKNYEIIVTDDCSTDNTEEVVKGFRDNRIYYYKNKVNLGYGKNLQACYERAKGNIIFLMGHDDILLKDALLKTSNAFNFGDTIGVVTRPYYWFYEDIKIPVRAIRPHDNKRDAIISIFDGKNQIRALFESAGQLSGLAYRKKYVDVNFHEEIFPAHIYPFASILKKHKAVYLRDYTVAVRIESSMTRHNSAIYNISPTKSWIRMFETVYRGEKYQDVKNYCINFITSENFVGLVQLKNYGAMRVLLREILILARYRPLNIFSFKFWFFSFGSIIIPRKILIWIVDSYKKKILSKRLQDIVIEL